MPGNAGISASYIIKQIELSNRKLFCVQQDSNSEPQVESRHARRLFVRDDPTYQPRGHRGDL